MRFRAEGLKFLKLTKKLSYSVLLLCVTAVLAWKLGVNVAELFVYAMVAVFVIFWAKKSVP